MLCSPLFPERGPASSRQLLSISPKFGRIRAEFGGPKAGELGPILTTYGTSSTDIGIICSGLGRIRADVDRHRADLGRFRPNSAQDRPDLTNSGPMSARIRPRIWTTVCPESTKIVKLFRRRPDRPEFDHATQQPKCGGAFAWTRPTLTEVDVWAKLWPRGGGGTTPTPCSARAAGCLRLCSQRDARLRRERAASGAPSGAPAATCARAAGESGARAARGRRRIGAVASAERRGAHSGRSPAVRASAPSRDVKRRGILRRGA